jgi:hypothetical protein
MKTQVEETFTELNYDVHLEGQTKQKARPVVG